MIDRARKAAALAVLLQACRRYGRKAFRVDTAGPNHKPLKDAEALGWCWFVTEDRCGILTAGHNALYLHTNSIREPHAVVSYQCQHCGAIVGQPDDGRGLPDDTPCPECHASIALSRAGLVAEVDAVGRTSGTTLAALQRLQEDAADAADAAENAA